MFKNQSIEHIAIRLIAVAVGSYVAFYISDHISGFLVHFLPNWFDYFLPSFVGYSITGLLLGLGLWSAFKQSAKHLVVLTPVFLLLTIWVDSYINFSEAGNSGEFSPWRILGWLLTTPRGFHLFIVLPSMAFVAIRFFSAKADYEEAVMISEVHNEQGASQEDEQTIIRNDVDQSISAKTRGTMANLLKWAGLWFTDVPNPEKSGGTVANLLKWAGLGVLLFSLGFVVVYSFMSTSDSPEDELIKNLARHNKLFQEEQLRRNEAAREEARAANRHMRINTMQPIRMLAMKDRCSAIADGCGLSDSVCCERPLH